MLRLTSIGVAALGAAGALALASPASAQAMHGGHFGGGGHFSGGAGHFSGGRVGAPMGAMGHSGTWNRTGAWTGGRSWSGGWNHRRFHHEPDWDDFGWGWGGWWPGGYGYGYAYPYDTGCWFWDPWRGRYFIDPYCYY